MVVSGHLKKHFLHSQRCLCVILFIVEHRNLFSAFLGLSDLVLVQEIPVQPLQSLYLPSPPLQGPSR